tara:strand:- start:5716 stop:6882 length:1167 start_codon:yes stop_codon:yes gene_type:complete
MTFLNASSHTPVTRTSVTRTPVTPTVAKRQHRLGMLPLGALLGTLFIATSQADVLPLDRSEQQRLGVEFSTLTTLAQLPLAVLPGSTAVSEHQRQQLMMPFEARVEQWLQAPGQHIDAGQPLLQLHSHETLAFLQSHQRLLQNTRLCHQRLTYLKDRQNSGLSSRLDVEEKSLECQQLDDNVSSNQQVLAHLPADWHNTHEAEFTLKSSSSGWLMTLYQQPGQIANPADGLAEFWPDSALAILVEMPAHLASQLQPGQSLNVQDSHTTVSQAARVLRIEQRISVTGQYRVWLQLTEGKPIPGQRWQVTIPSSQTGWTVPAAARVRANGQSWVFLKQGDQVEPVAIVPIAEGAGQLLLTPADLPAEPTLAIRGTAALMSYWQASSEGDE